MVLAKAAKMKPRDIADKLAEKLKAMPDIESVEVAGPGFLNMRFAPAFWQGVVTAILKEGAAYGRADLGKGERINVEYVSANPTGPMHVGHCRGAVFGDALANLLQFAGYDVTREYYINDAGAQVDALARSAYLRYREALGEDIGEIPAGPLSRRLPEAGRRRAGAGARPRAAQFPRGALAAAGARGRHRRACWC